MKRGQRTADRGGDPADGDEARALGAPEGDCPAGELEDHLDPAERYLNQYVLVPPGMYEVGTKEPAKGEMPERPVEVEAFRVAKFPVTNALFELFVEKAGYKTTAERVGFATVYQGCYKRHVDERTGAVTLMASSGMQAKIVSGACWYQPTGPGSTLLNKRIHPVVQVSLEDALAFATWAGKKLPTEEEWEIATRTAKGFALPWGNEWKKGSCNSEESYIGDTAPVEEHINGANDLGVVDALGNVWEWTLDTCEPQSAINKKSAYHIVKGGSWLSRRGVQLSSRSQLPAEWASNSVGFSCVAP